MDLTDARTIAEKIGRCCYCNPGQGEAAIRAIIRDELAKREPVRCETCRDDPRGIDQRLGGRGAAMLNGWTPCPDCAPPRQPEAGVGMDDESWTGECYNGMPHRCSRCGTDVPRRLLAPVLTEEVLTQAAEAILRRRYVPDPWQRYMERFPIAATELLADVRAALLAVGFKEEK